jgi:hypothetical protein
MSSGYDRMVKNGVISPMDSKAVGKALSDIPEEGSHTVRLAHLPLDPVAHAAATHGDSPL